MNRQTSVSLDNLAETELLHFLIAYAIDNNFSIALWRLPHSSAKHLILSQEYKKLETEFTLEDLPTGFLFAPYDKSKDKYFLPGDFIFTFNEGALSSPENPQECAAAAWLSEKLKDTTVPTKVRLRGTPPNASETDKEQFIAFVSTCIEEIENGSLEKVVPSRTKEITLPENFDVIHAFQKLCKRYAHAMVSFVSIPAVGNWLGATPEVLVTVEDERIFKTVALAGTKPYIENINVKSVAWTQKEIEEQALVERYIISCFKKIRLREYEEHGPKTIIAGNLMHLKSDFTVDMQATGFPQLGTLMLNLLHPTSAVCGMPLENSLAFLKQHEQHDRAFYAGYLGPVNHHKNINLFVNLRCMQLFENKGLLYSGAGVTIDSVPEHEWEETEIKFNTLLNVIF